MRRVHLQLGADPRERAAQLVGGIGDEAPLLRRRRGQPVEHRVHGACQPGDLVRSRRFGHPAVEAAGRDAVDLGTDVLDRSQHPSDQPPDEGRERRGAERDGDEEGAHEGAGAPLDVLEAAGDVDGGRAGRRRHHARLSTVREPPVGDRGALGHAGSEPDVAQAGRRGEHGAVRADHLGEDVVGRQVSPPERPPGTHLPGDGLRPVAQALVQALDQDRPVGEDDPGADGGQHAEHGEGGERGHPEAQAAGEEPPPGHRSAIRYPAPRTVSMLRRPSGPSSFRRSRAT